MTSGPLDKPILDFDEPSFLPGPLRGEVRSANVESAPTASETNDDHSLGKCSPPGRVQQSSRSLKTQESMGSSKADGVSETPKLRRSHHRRRRSSKANDSEVVKTLRSLLDPRRNASDEEDEEVLESLRSLLEQPKRKSNTKPEIDSASEGSKGSKENKDRSSMVSQRSSRRLVRSTKKLRSEQENDTHKVPPEKQRGHKQDIVEEKDSKGRTDANRKGSKKHTKSETEVDTNRAPLVRQKSKKKTKHEVEGSHKSRGHLPGQKSKRRLKPEDADEKKAAPPERQKSSRRMSEKDDKKKKSSTKPQEKNNEEIVQEFLARPSLERQPSLRHLEVEPEDPSRRRSNAHLKRRLRSRSREPQPKSPEKLEPESTHHRSKLDVPPSEDHKEDPNPSRCTASRRGSAIGRVRSRSADSLLVGKKKETTRKLPARTKSGTCSLQMLRDAKREQPEDIGDRSTFSSLSHKKREVHETRREDFRRRSSLGGKLEGAGDAANTSLLRREKMPILKPSTTKKESLIDELFGEDFQFPPVEKPNKEPNTESTLRTRRRLSNVQTSELKQPNAMNIIESSVARIPPQLQAIFLASNTGEEVDEPPECGDANKVYTRQRWLSKWRGASKLKKEKKEKPEQDFPSKNDKDVRMFAMLPTGAVRRSGKLKDHSKPPVPVLADPDSSEWGGAGDSDDEIFRSRRPEEAGALGGECSWNPQRQVSGSSYPIGL